MNRRSSVHMLAAVMAAVLGLGGCMAVDGKKEDNGKPVVVVLWHSYNAVAKGAFDDLVMEFNETVGMEQGIIVEPVGYGSSNELDDVLYASASRVIGSDPLPDIFSSYPDSAYRLDGIVPLVHLDDYFSEEELAAYRPEFLKEGVWEGDGIHRMIPVAKSTEILYLNETDWETFAGDTGADKEMLKTWEGLAQAAGMYYEWSGGSPFLGMNAFNDFAALSAAQLGEGIRWTQDGPEFNYSKDTARRVWDAYYVPHIKGWYESRTYNQDGIKSGRLMAYIGSSAGAGFFPQVVIEDEKQSHPISCKSYAYPVFRMVRLIWDREGPTWRCLPQMRATSRLRSGSLNGLRSRSRIYVLQWPQDICLCRRRLWNPYQIWCPMWKAGTMSRQWSRASGPHLQP